MPPRTPLDQAPRKHLTRDSDSSILSNPALSLNNVLLSICFILKYLVYVLSCKHEKYICIEIFYNLLPDQSPGLCLSSQQRVLKKHPE